MFTFEALYCNISKIFFQKNNNFFNLKARMFHFPKYKKNVSWKNTKKYLILRLESSITQNMRKTFF